MRGDFRRILGVAVALLLAGCEEETKPTPPPGMTTTPTTGGGGGTSGGGTSDTGGTSSTSSASRTSSGGVTSGGVTSDTGLVMGDSTGGGAEAGVLIDVLVESSFDFGPVEPTCAVRFYGEGLIDPTTGAEEGFTATQTFVVERFPVNLQLTDVAVGDVVQPGDVGYVAVFCDSTGDSMLDVGGFYPALPMNLVTIPADSLIVTIDELPS